jgi:hypothetical protein
VADGVDPITRREALALAGGLLISGAAQAAAATRVTPTTGPEVQLLTSRSGVYTPARGEAVMQFGFDFPESSVRVGGFLIGFRVQTFETVYALDPEKIKVARATGTAAITAEGFLASGGQEKAAGLLSAKFDIAADGALEWQVRAEAPSAIKSITTVIRGLPRGQLSVSGGDFADRGDDEKIFEYPQLFGGMSTPFIVLKDASGKLFELAARQSAVRPARFFFQPGPEGYRVELIAEHEGWARSPAIETYRWRVGPVASYEPAAAAHFAHVEKTYGIPRWEKRADAPEWMRNVNLVLSIHGAHWTGYIFNDYARTLEILRWAATQIEPRNVLVFLPAWDGRYYWNYPLYRPDPRMGGVAGFKRLVSGAQKLGFHVAPMFGTNSANKSLSEFKNFADAVTEHIDGDAWDLNWVDWDNDRRDEGWMPFMNVGVASWRKWLGEKISSVIDEFGVDAYFLDIAGAWENNRKADMYTGTVELVADVRARHPGVPPIGEMLYDAQMSCIPMSQVTRYAQYPAGQDAYVRSYEHLSRPAPGRGSTGVHEAGFGNYKPDIALNQRAIPTITIVDDTFSTQREAMSAYIAQAKKRAAAKR